MNKNIYGVILAGGSGSRLWPLSRDNFPKQLLKLIGDKSLFQTTFLRLTGLIPPENIITITNNLQLDNINTQLEELNPSLQNIALGEPVGRNTAPAIGLAALFIKNRLAEENIDPIVLISPSDHLIQNNEAFLNAVKEGVKLAENGYIVTFGITPSKPETGYGYIKTNKEPGLPHRCSAPLRNDNFLGYKVDEFKEKPDFETAKKYLEAGNYFWNSGIFIFKASTILQELQIHAPDVFEGLSRLNLSGNSIEKESYQAIPSISIDYAVMEKSDKIALIPVDCGWTDLGSWEAVFDAMQKDNENNFIRGNVLALNTENSYIYSSSRQVSTIGLKNVVVIETEDAVLVCDMSKTQDVKAIYDRLDSHLKSAADKITKI